MMWSLIWELENLLNVGTGDAIDLGKRVRTRASLNCGPCTFCSTVSLCLQTRYLLPREQLKMKEIYMLYVQPDISMDIAQPFLNSEVYSTCKFWLEMRCCRKHDC